MAWIVTPYSLVSGHGVLSRTSTYKRAHCRDPGDHNLNNRVAQIPGDRSPRRVNFVPLSLIAIWKFSAPYFLDFTLLYF